MGGRSFSERSPGVLHSVGGNVFAFVPHPLPPRFDIDHELATLLANASLALGRLDGLGHRLPNPHLLIRTFARIEAVKSSRIEGTQASLADLLEVEANVPLFPPSDVRNDALEVRNYVRALERGLSLLEELPISTRLLREVHAVLMEGVRGRSRGPGEIRKGQNWIGGRDLASATYVPPPPQLVPDLLSRLERYINQESSRYHALVDLALVHYQFEAIHPFWDGNGRVGRLLITLMLLDKKLLDQPLLYLSAYFENTRDQYYRHLQQVTAAGDWRSWVAYFLQGIYTQATDALERAARLVELRERYRKALQGERAYGTLLKVVDHLFARPIFTVRQLEEELDISFATANKAVAHLTRIGFLVERTGHKRNRLFAAREVLDLL
ncbi:Fic family protein [Oceanithermus sp.]